MRMQTPSRSKHDPEDQPGRNPSTVTPRARSRPERASRSETPSRPATIANWIERYRPLLKSPGAIRAKKAATVRACVRGRLHYDFLEAFREMTLEIFLGVRRSTLRTCVELSTWTNVSRVPVSRTMIIRYTHYGWVLPR